MAVLCSSDSPIVFSTTLVFNLLVIVHLALFQYAIILVPMLHVSFKSPLIDNHTVLFWSFNFKCWSYLLPNLFDASHHVCILITCTFNHHQNTKIQPLTYSGIEPCVTLVILKLIESSKLQNFYDYVFIINRASLFSSEDTNEKGSTTDREILAREKQKKIRGWDEITKQRKRASVHLSVNYDILINVQNKQIQSKSIYATGNDPSNQFSVTHHLFSGAYYPIKCRVVSITGNVRKSK